MATRAVRHPEIVPALLLGVITAVIILFLVSDNDSVVTTLPPVTTQQEQATEEIPVPISESPSNQLVFIDEAFMTLSRWQAQDIRPLLAASTAQAVGDEQLEYVLTTLQTRLGGLVSYEKPELVPVLDKTPAGDAGESLRSYKFTAHYTEGDALVNLVLQEAPEGFRLYHFEIQMDQG